ncbi:MULTISPECIES: hypothetical protein [Dactylosporangium]|uniref:Uncharacterized protein n=2 Tax=Dactylosporangium TaxID=35753 RepID=A0A9W6KTD9_9ACTN|nr:MULTISPECIES: hypothetical protein [Dactylosporangium]UAB98703.1 hypothetical protein Dvina_11840 [Dactylosporangium vinaceum]UWZ46956.1 hypothetical protein Dmats_11425 [Dactylosporangium matsuzakiense]GLL06847.1 hypothetical protein GCM10017581_085970 [Dactylosporangium matsuzakiense]
MEMMRLVDCPECGLPATARSGGQLAGTYGPVEHVHLRCVVGHRFFGPGDILLHRHRGRRAG